MKSIVKASIIISLIISIIACSSSSANTILTLTDEKPVVVLDTGNSNSPRIALFNGGEAIIPDVDINSEGNIVKVHGATFIAPDGKSIHFYFENGLPVRAIAEDNIIQFENFSESTVDIIIISPDGTITVQEQIPFDANKITNSKNNGNVHLAKLSNMPNNKDIDWLSFTSTAIGAFSCAATVATGGTLSVLFGVSCGIFVYTTYLKIVEKEPPVALQEAGTLVSGVSCATGILQREPIAAGECANLVIDAVQKATENSQETEQKLASFSNLTMEEKINSGEHTYFDTASDLPESYKNPMRISNRFYDNTWEWIQVDYGDGGTYSGNKIDTNAYEFVDEDGKTTIWIVTKQGLVCKSDTESSCELIIKE